MAVTPEEWLPVLAKRLDARSPRVRLLRQYMTGDAPMPEMTKNTRESWARFQREARTSFGLLAVDAVAERIVPNGIRVGAEDGDATLAAQRVWRDNRLDIAIADAVRNALGLSAAYLIVGEDENGHAVVSAESPEFVITAPDPLRPWVARSALKVWRDVDLGFDFAFVWADGQRQKFARRSVDENKKTVDRAAGGWTPVDEPETFDGNPPVIALANNDGVGEFEPHMDLLNRINRNLLQRLTTTAMQAFRQRWLEGELPDVDEDGNAIDWAKILDPAPGAIWNLPEGIKLNESSDSSNGIQAMLSGEERDIKSFAAVTRTPMSVLMPDSANQSAEGAAFAREGLVFKAKDRIARFKVGIELALVYALRIEGVEDGQTVEVMFEPPDRVSMSEKFAAAAQAKSAGISLKTIQKTILGWSPDQIAEDALNRADEQIEAMTALGSGEDTATNVDAVKNQADALGVLIRAGVDPASAAEQVGLTQAKFTGAVPTSLRLPESDSKALEEK